MNGIGPPLHECRQACDGSFIGVGPRIDSTKDDLVLQDHVSHQQRGIDGDRTLSSGNTSENKHRVCTEVLYGIEGEAGGACCFVNDIDIAKLFGHLLQRMIPG